MVIVLAALWEVILMLTSKIICKNVIIILATLLSTSAVAANLITETAFGDENEIILTFAQPITGERFLEPTYYTAYEKPDPDIRLQISDVVHGPDKKTATLTFSEPLNQAQPHIVTVRGISAGEKPLSFTVEKSYLGYLLTILITAMLIKNFVFTKYLGLCVFMGVSKKKETAKGMGFTFSAVMVVSASISWFLYNYVMVPFNLGFLQIVVFIGLVALSVQAVDTILRKVNPLLFDAFGIYLILITTNCVIIAVPLMLAKEGYGFWESLMLAVGAGAGFILALYLMASVRERLEVALVPESFKGLPVAFILAGQFALAFLGFSGMTIY